MIICAIGVTKPNLTDNTCKIKQASSIQFYFDCNKEYFYFLLTDLLIKVYVRFDFFYECLHANSDYNREGMNHIVVRKVILNRDDYGSKPAEVGIKCS